MNINKRGSVVFMCLVMLSLIAFLAERLMYLVYVGNKFDSSMVVREHAEMLALSGIDIAMATLTAHEQESSGAKSKGDGKADQKAESFKRYFQETYPQLNRWNRYTLKKEIDGVDGEIGIYITCESGKINLFEIFDFKKKELKKIYADMFKRMKFQVARGSLQLDDLLTEFFKKRERGVDDPSDLLEIKEFSFFDLFPDYRPIKKGDQERVLKTPRVLFDLFTLWGDETIDPLFLTESTALFFGLKRIEIKDDDEKHVEKAQQIGSSIKQEWWSNWKENIGNLKNIYEGKTTLEEGAENIFSKQFEPRIYSVVSFGLINGVKQRLFAILAKGEDETPQKNAGNEQNKEGKVKDKDRKRTVPFKLLKLYWI